MQGQTGNIWVVSLRVTSHVCEQLYVPTTLLDFYLTHEEEFELTFVYNNKQLVSQKVLQMYLT